MKESVWSSDDPPEPPPIRRRSRREAIATPETKPDFDSEHDAPEPWYYRFLETYAKVLAGLGIVAVACGTIVALLTLGVFVFTIPIIVASAVVAVLALLHGLAFTLLAVDAARNLREIRREKKK